MNQQEKQTNKNSKVSIFKALLLGNNSLKKIHLLWKLGLIITENAKDL